MAALASDSGGVLAKAATVLSTIHSGRPDSNRRRPAWESAYPRASIAVAMVYNAFLERKRGLQVVGK